MFVFTAFVIHILLSPKHTSRFSAVPDERLYRETIVTISVIVYPNQCSYVAQ